MPVVAVIDGFALGGGNELALSADYRIATRAALFGQPEVKLAIFPGYGGMQRLPRLTGIEFASWLAVNGEMIDAHTALAVGLVDEIHPPATALRRGHELVMRLAAGAPVQRRRDWDELGVARRVEADDFFAREDVKKLLRDGAGSATRHALDVRSARMAAARAALEGMEFRTAERFRGWDRPRFGDLRGYRLFAGRPGVDPQISGQGPPPGVVIDAAPLASAAGRARGPLAGWVEVCGGQSRPKRVGLRGLDCQVSRALRCRPPVL